mmetsp:Transcript_28100/g.90586  ORF Transcript_28100/g.90586 Transcript_28100/m.90586 type:complete len:209 (+) Transcript_28100:908-1534(+)
MTSTASGARRRPRPSAVSRTFSTASSREKQSAASTLARRISSSTSRSSESLNLTLERNSSQPPGTNSFTTTAPSWPRVNPRYSADRRACRAPFFFAAAFTFALGARQSRKEVEARGDDDEPFQAVALVDGVEDHPRRLRLEAGGGLRGRDELHAKGPFQLGLPRVPRRHVPRHDQEPIPRGVEPRKPRLRHVSHGLADPGNVGGLLLL